MSEHNNDPENAALPKPVDYDEMFPGRFLKAGLIQGKQIFTITAVDKEKMPQQGKPDKVRGILSFSETPMQLLLNSTNGQCLRAMFGKKVQQDWPGKKIVLCQEKDRFGRDVVDAIRVYGSPDIAQDITVTIDLGPRRKPVTRTLRAPRKAQPKPAETEMREIGQEG